MKIYAYIKRSLILKSKYFFILYFFVIILSIIKKEKNLIIIINIKKEKRVVNKLIPELLISKSKLALKTTTVSINNYKRKEKLFFL